MKTAAAYEAGARDALNSFGVRVAADMMSQRMPDGPEHLGAEWLSRRLGREKEHHDIVGDKPSHRKLERPPQWGPPASYESSGSNERNYAGVGTYGGV